MKLFGREIVIVFYFVGDFFLYVEIFIVMRKFFCGCDVIVNFVIVFVKVIIILISIIIWSDFLLFIV